MGTCEYCGKPLTRPTKGRPQSRFCSREHKEAARAEAQKRATQAGRVGRTCDQCGGPIPAHLDGRARFCKPRCRDRHHNEEQAKAKHEAAMARRAARPPCEWCGGSIPLELNNRARFCSREHRLASLQAKWREQAPDYMRQYLYGVTPEQWTAKLAEQDGQCAICRSDEWPGKGNRPHTDHDHGTGRFRGILDGNCNNGLGMFREDPLLLASAIVYLTRADPALLRAAAAYLEAALTV